MRKGEGMEDKLVAEIEDLPQRPDVKLVKFSGEVDISNSHRIVDVVFSLVDKGNIYLVADFGQINYINSAGIFNLLRCDTKLKEVGGWLRFINLKGSLLDVLDSLGITKIFAVCSSLDDALKEK